MARADDPRIFVDLIGRRNDRVVLRAFDGDGGEFESVMTADQAREIAHSLLAAARLVDGCDYQLLIFTPDPSK